MSQRQREEVGQSSWLGAALLATLLAVLGGSMALWLVETGDTQMQGDALEYHTLGINLSEGRGFGVEASPNGGIIRAVERPPLYPLMISIIYFLTGPIPESVCLVQLLLHGATAFMASGFAAAIGIRGRALWIYAVLMGSYPFTAFYVPQLLTETLATSLLTASVWLCLSAKDRSPLLVACAGLVLGLLSLTRVVFLALAIPLSAYVCFTGLHARRLRFASGALLLVAVTLTVAPWTARNYLLTGRFIPVALGNVGTTLYWGTWEYRDLSVDLPTLLEPWKSQAYRAAREEVCSQLPAEDGSATSTWRKERAFVLASLARIREAPLPYLRSMGFRAVKLWVSTYHPALPRWVWVLSALACLSYLGLACMGFFAWSAGRTGRMLVLIPILYLITVHLFFHAEARLSIPVRPLLLIGCALGVDRLTSACQAPQRIH